MAIAREVAPRAFSRNGINAMIGPRVIRRKLSEAGYFVQLRKERNAGIGGAPLLEMTERCQGRGSP